MITTETAKVYRAAGRRYFTKQAAYHAIVRAAVKAKCTCEPEEYDELHRMVDAGELCKYHADPIYYARVAARFVRFLKRRPA